MFTRLTLAIALAALFGAACASAQTAAPSPTPNPSPAPNKWYVEITPYVWVPNLNGNFNFDVRRGPGAGQLATLFVHVGPSSYLQHINFATMLSAYARHNTTSFGTDIIYLNMNSSDASVTHVSGPGGKIEIPINVSTSMHFRGSIWTLDMGQSISKSPVSPMEVLGGFRTTGLNASVDWTFTGPLGNLSRSGSASKTENVWDFIVGLRGKLAVGGRWYIPYYADYGGGNENNTFQALTGVGYAQNWGDILIVNRWLEYYYISGRGNENFQLVGPALAVKIKL